MFDGWSSRFDGGSAISAAAVGATTDSSELVSESEQATKINKDINIKNQLNRITLNNLTISPLQIWIH